MLNFVSILITVLNLLSPSKNGEEVLNEMHARFSGKWYKTFTFTQETQHYRNDSLVRTSTWHEFIVFPGKFRIDIGEAKDSNAVIYLNDSVFSFRKGKLVRRDYNADNLTFLLGGMYFLSLDSVKRKMTKDGYDLSKGYETKWKERRVYVIGAANAEDKSNQIWVDAEHLYIVKFVKFVDGEKEEGILSGHSRFGQAWSETLFDFYVNDKLVQKEVYRNCKANEPIDEEMFDPGKFRPRR